MRPITVGFPDSRRRAVHVAPDGTWGEDVLAQPVELMHTRLPYVACDTRQRTALRPDTSSVGRRAIGFVLCAGQYGCRKKIRGSPELTSRGYPLSHPRAGTSLDSVASRTLLERTYRCTSLKQTRGKQNKCNSMIEERIKQRNAVAVARRCCGSSQNDHSRERGEGPGMRKDGGRSVGLR